MGPAHEEQFREFAVASRPGLVRTAFLLCGDADEAHDLTQITLMRVHRRWASIRRTDDPTVYARRVLVNLTASWWRRRLRVRLEPLDPYDAPAGGDAIEQVHQRDELWRAVHTLPPRTRAVLVLRYFEDMSEADAARTLDCSVGSVKSQASRGLASLRQLLGEQSYDLGTWPEPAPEAVR
jgi:RNA polymerase sigma-70 factor (sigma-E family)